MQARQKQKIPRSDTDTPRIALEAMQKVLNLGGIIRLTGSLSEDSLRTEVGLRVGT